MRSVNGLPISEYRRQLRTRNIARYNGYERAWRKRNPEKVRELRARYRSRNRDKINERKRLWRKKSRFLIPKKNRFPNSLKPCCLCLYRIGFGVKRIGKMLNRNAALPAKWVRKAGIKDPKREATGILLAAIANKIRFEKFNSVPTELSERRKREATILAEYSAEIRAVRKLDSFWYDHKIAQRWRERNRRQTDPLFRAKFYARKRIRQFCKQARFKKRFSTSQALGCTAKQLVEHLSQRFRDGMTWENHGTVWHIDHVHPLAAATTVAEIKRLCHYTNLQPLLVRENMAKGDKVLKQQSLFSHTYLLQAA